LTHKRNKKAMPSANNANKTILNLSDLSKSYKKGLGIKRFYGLKDLSLEINQGELLGVIGPNGAGKTTTFKLILGLIHADKGTVEFGPSLSANGTNPKSSIGFLPENPYFYSYLTVEETIDFYARLFGFNRHQRRERVEALLELVGMTYARKRQMGKLSRGMLQRVGIAQALVNEPELLILDEPMSGLDPVGRKEIRDIIINFGKKGKTVIFSSHILSDVEVICDRVAIIIGGELKATGPINAVLDQGPKEWEIEYAGPELALQHEIESHRCAVDRKGDKQIIRLFDEALVYKVLDLIRISGGTLLSFNPRRTGLEGIYTSKAGEKKHA
jgi:ABC-2 type transport system ATP-binding protein